MHAKEVSLIVLIQGQKQFVVPLFQRTYSWQKRQYSALWRDVHERSRADAHGPAHFLGSVVLTPSPDNSASTDCPRYLLIDGQQRLTSLMLLLAAIRDHARSEDSVAADRIDDQCLVNKYEQGDDRLRLLPTQADRPAFRSIILGENAASGADGLTEAYQYFRSKLTAADDPDDPDDIRAIETTVRNRLSLVEIDVDKGDNVFRIFESLNNTGLALTQADLLRNYLFMRLPSRGQSVFDQVWLPMQQQLTSTQLELLVWLDLVVRGDERVRQSETYQAQQARLEELGATEDVVEQAIRDLSRRARNLRRLLDPETEPDEALRGRLEHLDAWGGQTAYPLVMHLLDLLDRNVATIDQVSKALEYVESFLVRRMICYIPTNNLNRIFNAAPREIGEVSEVADAVHRYLSAGRRGWPTDDELRTAAATRAFYWTGRAAQRSYVLRRLEDSYGSLEPVDYAKAKLTIEHVLPQTATSEWLAELAAEATDDETPVDLHDQLVHTLGNLTLTAENSKLSNTPFQRKQDILKSSNLSMNKEIAGTEHWGADEIRARSARLAERAIDLWPSPLPRTATVDQSGKDWSLLRQAVALIPAGTWTTYGELAALIGSHPVPVGVYLSSNPVPNAWRVLTADGSISGGFHWTDPEQTGNPVDVLTAEGVQFIDGRAAAPQRVAAQDLADLLGLDVTRSDDEPSTPDEGEEGWGRFLDLLTEHPEAVEPVRKVINAWRGFGGVLAYANGQTATCFPVLRNADRPELDIWPLGMKPASGRVEVPFRWMRERPPFDDVAIREELRVRLNAIDGVDLPAGKLVMMPAFPVSVLTEPRAVATLIGVLEWFAIAVRAYAADPDGARPRVEMPAVGDESGDPPVGTARSAAVPAQP